MCWFRSATSLCESRRCRRFCFRETRSIPLRIFFAICANAGSMVCGWIRGSRAAWLDVPSAGRTALSLRARLSRRNCGSGRGAMWWPSITGSTPRHSFVTRGRCRKTSGKSSSAKQKKTLLRLLYVSHYNYYRNFETLFRALPLIRDAPAGPEAEALSHLPPALGRQSGKLQRPGGFCAGYAAWHRGQRGRVGRRFRIPCCTRFIARAACT